MIPAYRCNEFLPQCLQSVLSQDLGPQQMQIAVVNDDPIDDECAKVVGAVGGNRIEYHRNETNLGAGGNFNRCLILADRDLVLILHGDCYLKERYFEKLSALAVAHPTAGMLACRAEGVDARGTVNWVSHRYSEFESLTSDDSPIWESLHLMPSAVVVRREIYGRIGGFRQDIANGQDWEMWIRVIRAAGIIMSPEVLAAYRQHGDSITGRTRRSAQNIREFAQLYALFAVELPGYPIERMRQGLRGMAFSQALEYRKRGDTEGALENFRAWRELTPFPSRVVSHFKRFVKTLFNRA
jgi:glycosyltransferase involved in cell wall biosynthesis